MHTEHPAPPLASTHPSAAPTYQPPPLPQARGAWYTFAGKGRDSPVAALHDCKLAAGRVLWATPVVQQLLALYDCCDTSPATLSALLTDKVRGARPGALPCISRHSLSQPPCSHAP